MILGRPNSGKSTLLNQIMGKKVAITTPKPQTTRKNKTIYYADERGEIYFVDTPGMFEKVGDQVAKIVNQMPRKGVAGADVVIHLADISRPKEREENKVIGLVRQIKAKKILVYNKVDKFKGRGTGFMADFAYLEDEMDAVLSISAMKGTHIKTLLDTIFTLLPTTNNKLKEEFSVWENEEEWVAEVIREKAFLALRKELPYTVGVKVETIQKREKVVYIQATIYTTEDKYKRMIIGENGKMVGKIGTAARKELELGSDSKIYLDIRIEANKHWPKMLLE